MPRVDPYRNFRFLVEIDGIVQAGFYECSGFGSSVEVVEKYRGRWRKLLRYASCGGLVSYPDISLKWGFLTDSLRTL